MTASFLTPRPQSGNGSADGSPVFGGSWDGSLPLLVQFLAARQWATGAVRTPGTLSLFIDEGTWKVCLSDRAQGLVAFVSGATPEDALLAAQVGLEQDKLDWRAQRSGNGNKRR